MIADQTDRFALLVPNGLGAHQDPARRAIAIADAVFHLQSALAAAKIAFQIVFGGLPVVRMKAAAPCFKSGSQFIRVVADDGLPARRIENLSGE